MRGGGGGGEGHSGRATKKITFIFFAASRRRRLKKSSPKVFYNPKSNLSYDIQPGLPSWLTLSHVYTYSLAQQALLIRYVVFWFDNLRLYIETRKI